MSAEALERRLKATGLPVLAVLPHHEQPNILLVYVQGASVDNRDDVESVTGRGTTEWGPVRSIIKVYPFARPPPSRRP
jgi:hypothetical protein